jgi:hypothetical protein
MPAAHATPSAGLRGDTDILRRALALHPGLYRDNSPRTFDARLSRLEAEFSHSRNLAERYLLLSAFLATIRCGHSQCNPYNQNPAVVRALYAGATRLPFRFVWLGGRMIVISDESGSELPRGAEILRINGVRTAALLDDLLLYARADGGNDGKRVAQMEMRGTETFETFDIFQGLLLPPTGGEHWVRVRTADGRVRDMALPALTLAERQARRRTKETDGAADPLWTREIRGDVAVLGMPTWVMYNSKWDWESWLDARLRSLAGARGLVIDLRDNEGGNDCGDMILARLAQRDLPLAGYERRVRFRTTPADLDPYVDTWDDRFRSIGKDASDIGNGFFRLSSEAEEAIDIITAATPRITVPVAALVGPTCSSATFSFARRARQSGLVRLFGETTGGNLKGINGDAFFFVRLPASGLEFDVPLVGYFPARPQADTGVVPHVMVRPTLGDIAHHRDPAMAAALDWASRV